MCGGCSYTDFSDDELWPFGKPKAASDWTDWSPLVSRLVGVFSG